MPRKDGRYGSAVSPLTVKTKFTTWPKNTSAEAGDKAVFTAVATLGIITPA